MADTYNADDYAADGTRRRFRGEGVDENKLGVAASAAADRKKLGGLTGGLGAASQDMPKQDAGESASAYGERLRVYREKKRDKVSTMAQKDALRRMA